MVETVKMLHSLYKLQVTSDLKVGNIPIDAYRDIIHKGDLGCGTLTAAAITP